MGLLRRGRSRGDDARGPGATRQEMDQALRSAVDQHLRPIGFTGSLPHLRRSEERIDLISVQHFSSGGSFVVEVACSPPTGHDGPRGHISPSKIRAQDINDPRPRLGSEAFPKRGDHWFVYGPRSYDAPDPLGYAPPHKLASDVVALVLEQAQPWWETQPFPGS